MTLTGMAATGEMPLNMNTQAASDRGGRMVLNGVRAQAMKRLREHGFDVAARVVKPPPGEAVDSFPEVTLRVASGDDYTYSMLQLNMQNGFGVGPRAAFP